MLCPPGDSVAMRIILLHSHPPQCFDSWSLAQPYQDIFSKYIAQQRMSIGAEHQRQGKSLLLSRWQPLILRTRSVRIHPLSWAMPFKPFRINHLQGVDSGPHSLLCALQTLSVRVEGQHMNRISSLLASSLQPFTFHAHLRHHIQNELFNVALDWPGPELT